MMPSKAAPSLRHVASDSTQDALVGIYLDKDRHITEVPQALVGKKEDAFDENRRPRLNLDGLIKAIVLGEIVHRTLDCVSTFEFLEMLGEQIGLKRIGMIVVHCRALLKSNAGLLAIVVVVVKDRYLIVKASFNLVDEG